MQDMLDQIAFDETKKLMVDLAINFSRQTKIEVVPEGTRSWRTEKYDPKGLQRLKTITVDLIPFFGIYAGYNSELDILVIWHF